MLINLALWDLRRRENVKFETVILERKGRMARIILNRPQVLNALNRKLMEELKAAIEEIERDEEVDVVVLTGAGRAFCAGVDLKEAMHPEHAESQFTHSSLDAFDALTNLDRPVICALRGYALTGGLELALCCDLIVASEDAFLGDTHARIGAIPGAGSSQKLPRLVGAMKAKEFLFTSDLIPARQAERIGLVNRVVPEEKLDEAVEELAEKIMGNNQASVRTIKSMVNRGLSMDLASGMIMERAEFMRFRLGRRALVDEGVEGAFEKTRAQARKMKGS